MAGVDSDQAQAFHLSLGLEFSKLAWFLVQLWGISKNWWLRYAARKCCSYRGYLGKAEIGAYAQAGGLPVVLVVRIVFSQAKFLCWSTEFLNKEQRRSWLFGRGDWEGLVIWQSSYLGFWPLLPLVHQGDLSWRKGLEYDDWGNKSWFGLGRHCWESWGNLWTNDLTGVLVVSMTSSWTRRLPL